MQVSTNEGGSLEYVLIGDLSPHFRSISNAVPVSVLHCPFNPKRTAVARWDDLKDEDISYFLGVDAQSGDPLSILAGDVTLEGYALEIGKMFSWGSGINITWQKDSHRVHTRPWRRKGGNLLFADGSVHFLNDRGLRAAVKQSVLTNRVIMP